MEHWCTFVLKFFFLGRLVVNRKKKDKTKQAAPRPSERKANNQDLAFRLNLERFDMALDMPIAVVGMGCRLPGESSNPDKLWQVLSEGKST